MKDSDDAFALQEWFRTEIRVYKDGMDTHTLRISLEKTKSERLRNRQFWLASTSLQSSLVANHKDKNKPWSSLICWNSGTIICNDRKCAKWNKTTEVLDWADPAQWWSPIYTQQACFITNATADQ